MDALVIIIYGHQTNRNMKSRGFCEAWRRDPFFLCSAMLDGAVCYVYTFISLEADFYKKVLKTMNPAKTNQVLSVVVIEI